MGEINQQKSQKTIKKETVITGKELEKPQKRGVFIKGYDPRRNLAGRPEGSRDFITLFRIAMKRIAEENKIDIEEPEIRLLLKGYKEALRGNFNFWNALIQKRFPDKPQLANPFTAIQINFKDEDLQ